MTALCFAAAFSLLLISCVFLLGNSLSTALNFRSKWTRIYPGFRHKGPPLQMFRNNARLTSQLGIIPRQCTSTQRTPRLGGKSSADDESETYNAYNATGSHRVGKRLLSLSRDKLKTGPFTAQEDALIRQRAAEWGNEESGLWDSLGQELGRTASSIEERAAIRLAMTDPVVAHTPIVPTQQRRYYFSKAPSRQQWSPYMDVRLKDGVELYKESGGWKRVAEHVGGGVTWRQCEHRWNSYLGKALQGGIKLTDWSNKEMCQLEELVPQHVIKPYWSEYLRSTTQEHTDWVAIGKVLNRIPKECKSKWILLQNSRMKKGFFTAEEDAVIRQRVAEWGDQGQGLWTSLQQELGRRAANIRHRWRSVLAPKDLLSAPKVSSIHLIQPLPLLREKPAPRKWTAPMEARLTEGVALYKESGGWKRVAEHIGGGVTWKQCESRWLNYLAPAQQEGIKLGDWSGEEMQQLEELVPQHVIKPYWSDQYKVRTQERTNWIAIGKAMDRIPSECANKWLRLQASRMKKGRFTAEEDALIVKRVEEWGDKGQGLWVSLQQELGRPGARIRQRWTRTLSPYDGSALLKQLEVRGR